MLRALLRLACLARGARRAGEANAVRAGAAQRLDVLLEDGATDAGVPGGQQGLGRIPETLPAGRCRFGLWRRRSGLCGDGCVGAGDSRIIPSQGGFIAGYNGQIAVAAGHQVIIAQRLSTNPADFAALALLMDQARAHLGRKPHEVSGDSGFATEANLTAMADRRIRAFLRPGRIRHGQTDPTAGRILKRKPAMQAMADTIRRAGGRSRYRLRKQVVEPVFGLIKQARGSRQFLLCGLDKVRAEWAMLCTAHNLLKLHRTAA